MFNIEIDQNVSADIRNSIDTEIRALEFIAHATDVFDPSISRVYLKDIGYKGALGVDIIRPIPNGGVSYESIAVKQPIDLIDTLMNPNFTTTEYRQKLGKLYEKATAKVCGNRERIKGKYPPVSFETELGRYFERTVYKDMSLYYNTRGVFLLDAYVYGTELSLSGDKTSYNMKTRFMTIFRTLDGIKNDLNNMLENNAVDGTIVKYQDILEQYYQRLKIFYDNDVSRARGLNIDIQSLKAQLLLLLALSNEIMKTNVVRCLELLKRINERVEYIFSSDERFILQELDKPIIEEEDTDGVRFDEIVETDI